MEDQADFVGWILGSLSSGVVAIDADGRLVVFNAGAQRILGCPSGELSDVLGTHCSEVLDAQPAVARLLVDTLDGRAPLSRAELVLDDADGRTESTIGFTLTPVCDHQEVVRGAAMIFRDLTPLECMDEQERLRERLAAMGQMAADLAHEMRNPLASMEVVAGLLKRRLVAWPEEQSLVADLLGELRSLAETVTSCLEFVRPLSLERGPLDPAQLLDESLAIAMSRTTYDGVIDRAYPEELPQMTADVDELRSVMVNLIVNAFEAMSVETEGRKKRLLLEIEQIEVARIGRAVCVDTDQRTASEAHTRQEIVITISDTGPGIPSELREKIFYPFFTTKQNGSGVGLASAQKIVASHGGSLELDVSSRHVCSFKVRLPVEDDKP